MSVEMKSKGIWINSSLNSEKTQTVKWNKEVNSGDEERSHERDMLKIPYSNFGMKSLIEQLKTSVERFSNGMTLEEGFKRAWRKSRWIRMFQEWQRKKIGHNKQSTWDLCDNRKDWATGQKEGGWIHGRVI